MNEIEKILNGEEENDKTPRILKIVLGVIVVCAAVIFCVDIYYNLKKTDFNEIVPPTVSEVKEVVEAGKNIPAIDKNMADAEAKVIDKQGYGYSQLNVSDYGQIADIDNKTFSVTLYDTETQNDKIKVELVGVTLHNDAEKILKEKFKNKSVLIEYEHNDKTKAYLYTTDGEMIQSWLISSGYAEYDGSKIYHRDILKKAGEK